MKRQLRIGLGVVLLLSGWISAFLLNSMPPGSNYYIIGPTLLLGGGLGLIFKTAGGKLTAVTVALTALAALLTINQIYPSAGVTISAFEQGLQQPAARGTMVPLQVAQDEHSGPFATERQLEAFADLDIKLFARLPGPVRMLAFDDTGRLYASIPKLGAIYLLKDENRDGFAEQPILFHVGLDRPHGLVWDGDKLYVAETSHLLELQDRNGDNSIDTERTILDGLPDDGGHWTRSLALGKDGSLYLSIGSRCNACAEADPLRATVIKVDPATGQSAVYASGLRNSVGLAFAPGSDVLWGSDNGRDMLGDNVPPDEINRIAQGQDYGWPYCYGQRTPDPELGSAARCKETIASVVDLQAHSAPLGINFGAGLKAPAEYRNSLYVALHGSWNRTTPTGYKLVRIPFVDGRPSGPAQEFLRGWLLDDSAWGRPVDPVVGPDGNLYLSDDRADAIYRIHWKKAE